MTSATLLQWLVIAPLLLWSIWRVAKQCAPTRLSELQNRLAQGLVKQGYYRIGSWLQSGTPAAGCGSGCASCNSCAPTSSAHSAANDSCAVRWRDSGHH